MTNDVQIIDLWDESVDASLSPSHPELKERFQEVVHPAYRKLHFDDEKALAAFLPEPTEIIAFEYVHLGRGASTVEVLAEFQRLELRHATYRELLIHAELAKGDLPVTTLAALGSVKNVEFILEPKAPKCRLVARVCPAIDRRGQILTVEFFGGYWHGTTRFLGVRKQNGASF